MWDFFASLERRKRDFAGALLLLCPHGADWSPRRLVENGQVLPMNAISRCGSATPTSSSTKLSKGEVTDLRACEDVIRRGFKIFVKVGNALRRIRDERLYRAHYTTFEEYVQQWDVSRVYAYQIMDASAVVEGISEASEVERLPSSVTQARELGRVKDFAQRCQIWQDVVDEANRERVPITAKRIRAAVMAQVPERAGEEKHEPKGPQEFTIPASRERVENMLGDLESGLSARDWDRMEALVKQFRRVLQSSPSSAAASASPASLPPASAKKKKKRKR